jgi:hypothetical protein
MSLARRAALQTRTRAALPAPASQKRCLAHDAHAHEHEHEHDAALYPPEPGTFNWAFFLQSLANVSQSQASGLQPGGISLSLLQLVCLPTTTPRLRLRSYT